MTVEMSQKFRWFYRCHREKFVSTTFLTRNIIFFNWMWGLYKNSRFHTNYSPSSIKIHWMPCFPDYYLCFVLVLCLAGHGSRTWSLSNSWKLVPSVHTGISTYVLGNHCCGKMQANCWFDSQQWVINLTMTCCCGLDLFVNMFFVLMMALCGT